MNEKKKINGSNRKFPVDACIYCIFSAAAQKLMFVLQQAAFPKTLFHPFHFKLECVLVKKKKGQKIISLTFLNDGLICHNNVVIYMLKDKRLDYHMQR